MKPIIQLEQRLIDKIAAGEVVERPLSVVKELTENAIDAGASMVTVELAEGGLSMIRVTDNGSGIPADQLLLAFSRHATSKIERAEDLFSVLTLGFRGEALSSIAAVAQVEMVTKTASAVTGVRAEIHGGRFINRQDIGCANGTTVVVSNLFYNVPARRKFLKKPATEAGYISECLQKLALGNPRLGIRYINNGSMVFQTNGSGDLRTALLNVYGREVAGKSLAVDARTGDMRLHGLLGKPEIARGNRNHGTFFINGRYVQSRLLSNAVEAAFATMLPSGKFPLYVLSLTLPAELLDVNVHPTKMDVRFAEEDAVRNFIHGVLEEVLSEQNLAPTARTVYTRVEGHKSLDQIALDERPPAVNPSDYYTMRTYAAPVENTMAVRETDTPRTAPVPVTTQALPPRSALFAHYQIQGLIFGTYWLVTQGEVLYAIDQHAAHERVLYETLLYDATNAQVHSQVLLAPVPLRLTPRERQTLQDNISHFSRLGFEVSGQDEITLTAVPFLFKGPVASDFFMEVLDKLADGEAQESSIYANKTELIALSACKAAVKAGDHLNEAEARDLIKQLLTLENPFTCPHGRPTMIEITRRELERRFKRT
ncbi:MAG: DNA mismatch repair endonuclease MutL [Defluviitaleaceae bacterium]|nr:DNA mismatch repair endonuclease MutL [Defluviitaleaceae bacterium]MCL2275486.1 DNA mismatch repair endonuclease MutL [Defluviitaleaceae bacterium]